MAKKRRHFISAFAVTVFAAYIYMAGCYGYIAEPYTVSAAELMIPDMTEAFAVILQGATKEFIAGYPINVTFLMWLDASYGNEAIYRIAAGILDGEMDVDLWYDVTGATIHVLWVLYLLVSVFNYFSLVESFFF